MVPGRVSWPEFRAILQSRAVARAPRLSASADAVDAGVQGQGEEIVAEDTVQTAKAGQSRRMTFRQFADSMFEVADLWCATVDLREYV